jgi:hypothetical protein
MERLSARAVLLLAFGFGPVACGGIAAESADAGVESGGQGGGAATTGSFGGASSHSSHGGATSSRTLSTDGLGGGADGGGAGAGGNGMTGDARPSCDLSRVLCQGTVPTCGEHEVPVVDLNTRCYSGGCIAPHQCACTKDDDCPDGISDVCGRLGLCTYLLH